MTAGLGWPSAPGTPPATPMTPTTSDRPAVTGLGWPGVPSTVQTPTVPRETPAAAGGAGHAGVGVSRETTDAANPIEAAARAAVRIQSGSAGTPLPRPSRPRVVVTANQKGGVGKTTSVVNLAAALALLGQRVLVLDLDPQGNASTALGVDHAVGTPSVYEVLLEDRPIAEVARPTPGIAGLSVVPSTIDLAGAEIELVPVVAREARLRRAVAAHLAAAGPDDRPDWVLLDCPPSLGLLTLNALVAAEEVLIPIQCEYYALEGLGQLVQTVEMVRTHLNARLAVTAVLLTMYDARTRLAAQVADEVRRHFGDRVLATAVPRSVRVSEAPSYGQTVLTYDPGSPGSLSYLQAARELSASLPG